MAVLVAVSVWGVVAVVTRFVDQVNGLVLAFHRLWIGAAATLAVFYATGRRLSWRTIRLSIPGGLAFGGDIVLFFSALRHTTVANATVVGALQPALVMLVAGRLFGEAVTAGIIGWSLTAIVGVAIVVYGSSGAPVWSVTGDLLAAGSEDICVGPTRQLSTELWAKAVPNHLDIWDGAWHDWPWWKLMVQKYL